MPIISVFFGISRTALRLVRDWIDLRNDEIDEDWNNEVNYVGI
jgi:hypothetical protein